jgi:hypothetical protein
VADAVIEAKIPLLLERFLLALELRPVAHGERPAACDQFGK